MNAHGWTREKKSSWLWHLRGAACLAGYQAQISGWAAGRHKQTDEVSHTHPEELCSGRHHLQRGERRQIRDQGEGINWYKIRGDLCPCVLHRHGAISSLDLDSFKWPDEVFFIHPPPTPPRPRKEFSKVLRQDDSVGSFQQCEFRLFLHANAANMQFPQNSN